MAPTTMRAWRVHRYGQPTEVLSLDEVPVPEPGPGEVRVRVLAAPLNLNDLERITGGPMLVAPDLPAVPGMETLGVVDACGDGVEDLAGQRVAATTTMAHGGFAEYVCCPAASAYEVPDAVVLPDAACLYFPFHLAWLGLFDRADLQPGEWVLVHAGAGGSGSAAIQLARWAGARVIATVGSDAKQQVCLDLGAEHVLGRDDDLVPAVLAATGGRGVDVVFDNVGPAVLDASLRATAYGGRYLQMGFASDKAAADRPLVVPRAVSMGNLHVCGVVLAYQPDELVPIIKEATGYNLVPASVGRRIHERIVELVVAGDVRPLVGEVVSFGEIPAALARLTAGGTVGRTVALLDGAG